LIPRETESSQGPLITQLQCGMLVLGGNILFLRIFKPL
jgi:hypothetical protein